MFKRVARAVVPRSVESKRESAKSKKCNQESKRNYNLTDDQPGRTFTQTTKSERSQMAELYRQGNSINIIAQQFRRSNRTVHLVLTRRGTHPSPERDEPSPSIR